MNARRIAIQVVAALSFLAENATHAMATYEDVNVDVVLIYDAAETPPIAFQCGSQRGVVCAALTFESVGAIDVDELTRLIEQAQEGNND